MMRDNQGWLFTRNQNFFIACQGPSFDSFYCRLAICRESYRLREEMETDEERQSR